MTAAWVGVLLVDAKSVLELKPDYAALAGIAPERYVASQGTALRRSGRVHVERIGTETWIGGAVCAVAEGTIAL